MMKKSILILVEATHVMKKNKNVHYKFSSIMNTDFFTIFIDTMLSKLMFVICFRLEDFI